MTRLVWRWRRWRARQYVWAADVNYARCATPAAGAAWARAVDHLRHVEAAKP